MTSGMFADRQLTCVACGDGFIFTAGEQELLQLRGIETEPDTCPACARWQATRLARAGRRAGSPG